MLIVNYLSDNRKTNKLEEPLQNVYKSYQNINRILLIWLTTQLLLAYTQRKTTIYLQTSNQSIL